MALDMTATRLDRALRGAGIPISGVAVGDKDDRATWRVDYLVAATAQQRSDGETLRLTFDPNSQAAIDAEKAEFAAALDNNPLIQAVAMLDFEERQKVVVQSGQTLRTLAQCKQRVKAIYQSLL